MIARWRQRRIPTATDAVAPSRSLYVRRTSGWGMPPKRIAPKRCRIEAAPFSAQVPNEFAAGPRASSGLPYAEIRQELKPMRAVCAVAPIMPTTHDGVRLQGADCHAALRKRSAAYHRFLKVMGSG